MDSMDEKNAQQKGSSRSCKSHTSTPCVICSKKTWYKYYNTSCCESCKQFFRRSILGSKEYKCGKLGRCSIARGEKCAACRLVKCLQVGMDPGLVSQRKKKFLDELKEGCGNGQEMEAAATGSGKNSGNDKIIVQKKMPIKSIDVISWVEKGTLSMLLRLIDKHRRLWVSATELPPAYLHKHADLGNFLGDRENLFGMAEKFKDEPPPFWDKQYVLKRTEISGMFIPEHSQLITKDHFISIEFIKAMHFLNKLNTDDQIALIRHVSPVIVVFFAAYYSCMIGANTWIMNNGLTPITLYYESTRFGSDPKLRSMSSKLYSDSVDIFMKAKINREEFALLLPLLATNTVGADISPSAHKILYEESCRLSAMLLQMLQRDHGNFCGAQRFAALMGVLNGTIKIAYSFKLLKTYLEVFHITRVDTIAFPKLMTSLW